MNLSKAKFALIPALFALLKSKNVTRAAQQLNISQSAMSKVFAQLRDAFDDELLVRSGKQYTLTSRAEGLLVELESIMPLAQRLWLPGALDLANESRFINIAGTDMDIDFISHRLERILAKAPKAGIAVTTSGEDSLSLLHGGDIDFLCTAFDSKASYLSRALLIHSDYVVLVNRDANIERMTLEHYMSHDHVAFQLSNARKSAVDMHLERERSNRRICLWTPTFHHAIKTVACSSRQLLLTIPRAFAERSPFSSQLLSYPLPLPLPDIKVYLYWHNKINSDPYLNWARDILLDNN